MSDISSLKLLQGGRREEMISSLVTSDRTVEQSCIRGSLDQTLEKGFSQRGCSSLEQAPGASSDGSP